MISEANEILELFQQEKFDSALIRCSELLEKFMNVFMEDLTVNSATDLVGTAILYARICGAMKKPWKAFPELEKARGALRFLKDFMKDSEILSDAFRSFGEAYAYGGYLPEAVSCFADAARFSDSSEKIKEALSSAFFYQERFGKKLLKDVSFAKEKLDENTLKILMKSAKEEARDQILTDPVESSDSYLAVRFEAEKLTDELLEKTKSQNTPFCVSYWNTKKRILKDKFGIDWKSPADMNPEIRFY